jgi:hypothetical protein
VVLIRGEHIPTEVQVLFAGNPASILPICRPEKGEIDATPPTGLLGDVEVRVQSVDKPDNADSLVLRFVEREVPRPYCKHLDRRILRARREELKLTQQHVAEQVGSSQYRISHLEIGRWTDPPDELFVRLAKLYGLPLRHFLKQRS